MALLTIIKGSIGAKTVGKVPTDNATKLGNIQSIKAYSIGRIMALKNKVALTIGPVMGWKWKRGATIEIARRVANVVKLTTRGF